MSDPDDKDLSDAVSFGAWFFYALDFITDIRERALSPAEDLGTTRDADVRLLVEIARRNSTGEATSHKALALGFGWSDKTLSNDLDRLERGGYISRERGEKDRRLNICTIEDRGRALLVAVFGAQRGDLQALRLRRFPP